MKRIFLIGIALLFLAMAFGSANADLTGDFSVSCDCLVPGQSVLTLSNTTATKQAYAISSSSENKDWINANGKWIGKETLQITLEAGETANVYLFVKPQNCYVSPGNYTATILVSSAAENYSNTLDITVNPSRVLEISADETPIELKQCEQKNLDITIKNVGKSDELVFVSITGIPKSWFELSQESFILEKGNSKAISAIIKPECSAVAKEYNFTINTRVQEAGFTASKSLLLRVIDAQQIEISSAALNACTDKQTENSTITIKNNGRLEDSLEISATGLDWVETIQGTITLAPGEQKNISVTFKKTGTAAGTHNFVIKAHSTVFNKDTEKEFSALLQDCFGISIFSVTANGMPEPVEACIEESLDYEFELLNDKAEAIEVDVSLAGTNAVLSPSTATILPMQKQLFKAEIDLSSESAGDKNFELIIKSDYFSMAKQFSFKAVDCYALLVDYDGLDKPIDVNASNSKANKENPFVVTIKNIGTKNVTVNAAVQGKNWVYFQPTGFALNAGEDKAIYLYFDPPYDTKQGRYDFTLKVSAEHFSDEQQATANVYGGLYGDIGEAKISTSEELSRIIEEVEKTVDVDVKIRNDSNIFITIEDLNAIGYNASFAFAPARLEPGQEITVKMTLFLGKGFSEKKFVVPVRIATDKGTIVQDIEVDLNAPQKPFELPLIGWISIGSIQDIVLIGLIIIVLALVLVMIFKAGTKQAEPKQAEQEIESYWQAPEEKTEKKTIKHESKSIEEIVKEVRKKHRAKAKTAKKKK